MTALSLCDYALQGVFSLAMQQAYCVQLTLFEDAADCMTCEAQIASCKAKVSILDIGHCVHCHKQLSRPVYHLHSCHATSVEVHMTLPKTHV